MTREKSSHSALRRGKTAGEISLALRTNLGPFCPLSFLSMFHRGSELMLHYSREPHLRDVGQATIDV